MEGYFRSVGQHFLQGKRGGDIILPGHQLYIYSRFKVPERDLYCGHPCCYLLSSDSFDGLASCLPDLSVQLELMTLCVVLVFEDDRTTVRAGVKPYAMKS